MILINFVEDHVILTVKPIQELSNNYKNKSKLFSRILKQRKFYFWGLLIVLTFTGLSFSPNKLLFLVLSNHLHFLLLSKPCFLLPLDLCMNYFYCLERYYSFIKQFLNDCYWLVHLRIWYGLDMILALKSLSVVVAHWGRSQVSSVLVPACASLCPVYSIIESTIYPFLWHCCLSAGWMNKTSQGMWFLSSNDFFLKATFTHLEELF